MEKFSAYRDAGTGIHPFLPPTVPNPPSALHAVLLPARALAAVLRVVLLLALGLIWSVFRLVSFILIPIPPLYTLLARTLDTALVQSAFLILGFYVSEELIAVNRSKAKDLSHARWRPRKGDLIVFNWVSWPELIWFSAKYRATIVLPLASPPPPPPSSAQGSPISSTGRRTGTGSAAISLPPPISAQPRASILGFRQVGLWSMLAAVGKTPPFFPSTQDTGTTIEEIRKRAKGPVVVLPECTTSNGRALLRFAEVFGQNTVPTKGYHVWLACVKYEPPSNLQPTLTQSLPSPSTLSLFLPPLLFLAWQPIHLRLLNPAESPSSQTFLASQYLTGAAAGVRDQLAECCAALIAQVGRMRRAGMGWEDKVGFLGFWAGGPGRPKRQ